MSFERIVLIVLDSVGIGELPDAEQFGDAGAHTLKHIMERVPNTKLPNLQKLGLGNIATIPGLPPATAPQASFGKMAEASVGKDTMTGHWELMGLNVKIPFRTFPNGFPPELIAQFVQKTGRQVLANKPASGTEIIAEYGEEQMKTGSWIVYTSADSVFQLAAHEEMIPLEEQYAACEYVRSISIEEPYAIGRVIARPYIGTPEQFTRTTNRRDYALKPPEPTVMNLLQDGGLDCIAVGKIDDIFSGEGVTEAIPTKSNADGMKQTIDTLQRNFKGMLFTNLVDFDSLYGHRRDPVGYASALEQFDQRLPELMQSIGDQDLLIITADHGNDPTHSGTDHTREYVPLLAWSPRIGTGKSLGTLSTFADVGATIAHNFQLATSPYGTSFLAQIQR